MPHVEVICKFCSKPATARWDFDADQEAVDKFLPMVLHNHCADLMRKRNDSEDRIIGLCFEYARASEDQRGKMIDRTRKLLLEYTRRYAEAIAAIRHLPMVMWSEDFVDLLTSKPEQAPRILHEYRKNLDTPSTNHNQTTADPSRI